MSQNAENPDTEQMLRYREAIRALGELTGMRSETSSLGLPRQAGLRDQDPRMKRESERSKPNTRSQFLPQDICS